MWASVRLPSAADDRWLWLVWGAGLGALQFIAPAYWVGGCGIEARFASTRTHAQRAGVAVYGSPARVWNLDAT